MMKKLTGWKEKVNNIQVVQFMYMQIISIIQWGNILQITIFIMQQLKENLFQVLASKDIKHKYLKYSHILRLIIDFLQINSQSYVILGSYSLRYFRIPRDLDVDMDSRQFTKLSQITLDQCFTKFYPLTSQQSWVINLSHQYNTLNNLHDQIFEIQIFCCNVDIGYPNQEFSLSSLFNSIMQNLVIDEMGHYCYNAKRSLKFKEHQNREKDQNDITILRKIISEENMNKCI